MKVGDRVVFFAAWSSWRGEHGTVTQTKPLFVLLDGDVLPIAASTREVVVDACGAPFLRMSDGAEMVCALSRGHSCAHHWEPMASPGFAPEPNLTGAE